MSGGTSGPGGHVVLPQDGSRGLASSPGSAQLSITCKRNSGRGPGIYKLERMVEKIFNCAWVQQPQNTKKSQSVLGNLQHVSS